MANFRAHNKDNYEVAKKLQLFGRPQGSTDAADWISFGSVKGVQMESEDERLQHFSNYLGARAMDREEIIERRYRLDFTLEEINVPNLKLALGRGFRSSADGTKDLAHEKTVVNPGPEGYIEIGLEDVKNLIVRSAGLEDPVTYVEETHATDSTEDTANNDFNNTTSPLTLATAVTDYGAITFVEGMFIKIQNELLRVTDVTGNSVTFSRGQLGTTNAVHANANSIFVSGGGDYAADLVNGDIAVLPGGDLEDENTVEEFHIFCEKEVNVEEFEAFDGQPIECELKLQYGMAGQVEKILGPFANCILKNNGPLVIGDGSEWAEIPMQAEIAINPSGSFGTIGAVKEDQS